MSIEYEINEKKRLVLAKGSGLIKGTDVLKHLDTLAKDDKYISPMKKLVDYRTIDNILISSEEAILIAQKKKALANRFYGEKCAFISPGDLTYGTSRVHQALVQGTDINTEVFRNIDDALNWLDITLDSEL